MEKIREKLGPLAEYVVSLTGFGTALHVNDVMPEFKKAYELGANDQKRFWLEYIAARAEHELNSHVYQIEAMLKTDAEVARKKLAEMDSNASTTEGSAPNPTQ